VTTADLGDRGGSGARDPAEGAKSMSFWEHLDELRRRLVWSIGAFLAACGAAWAVRERMLAWLVKPFADSWAAQHLPGPATLHFGAPGAAFVAYLKLSMIGGIALAAPIVFYQLWAFVAPGLYAKEKRFVIPFVVTSSGLFVGGGYFGWRAAFPLAFNYFLSMSGTVGGQGVTITPTVMMGEYLDFVMQMLLAFGVVFEIPLFILFLSMAGIVNYLSLIKFGRWFVLIAFVVAAVMTPPDVTSQLLMALPMCLLYFLSIGLAFLFGKKPTEEQRAAYRRSKKADAASED
jgi:sec-independent protein translocase protein TatC